MKRVDSIKAKEIIEKLSEDMGNATFLDFIDFIVDVMQSDYDIKILMARRFLDIYCKYQDIIEVLWEELPVPGKGKLVTNLSVPLYEEELKDKHILIADDIFLRGKALDEMCNYLVDVCGCQKNKIDIKIFLQYSDDRCEKSYCKYLDRVQPYITADESQWRLVSSSIVNSFLITGQPYISYLPHMELALDSDASKVIREFLKNKGIQNISTSVQRANEVETYIWYVDEKKENYKYSSENFVRIYIYNELNKVVIVPYSYMKPIAKEQMFSILQQMVTLGIVNYNIPEREEALSDELYRYYCCMMTYLVSLDLGKVFLDELGINEHFWITDIQDISFGTDCFMDEEHAEEIVRFFEVAADKLFLDEADDSIVFEEESKVEELVYTIYSSEMKGKSDIERFIDSFVVMSNERNTVSLSQNVDIIKGLPIWKIYQLFGKELYQKIWNKLTNIIDTGRATIVMSSFHTNRGEYISSKLVPGEQNFTCNEENVICLGFPLMQYEIFCKKHNILGYLQEGKRDIINKILSNNEDLARKISEEEIKRLLEKEVYEGYFDYYMRRLDIYKPDKRFINALKIEKGYEMNSL